jgi:hypothetical protein
LALIHDFSGIGPGDRVLALTPLVQFGQDAVLSVEPQVEIAPSVSC